MLFDYNSHILKSAARAAISKVVGSIENPNGVRIIVTGHTDSDGSEAYNFELSQNRAQAVTEYILANSGLSPAQIQSFGRGEEVPIASNATEAGKARNRRVEITIVPTLPARESLWANLSCAALFGTGIPLTMGPVGVTNCNHPAFEPQSSRFLDHIK